MTSSRRSSRLPRLFLVGLASLPRSMKRTSHHRVTAGLVMVTVSSLHLKALLQALRNCATKAPALSIVRRQRGHRGEP